MFHPRAKPVDSTWRYVQKPIPLPSALWSSTILSCLDIAVASSLVSLPPLPPLQSILSNAARMTPLKQKAGHVTPLLTAFKGFPFQRKSQKCSPWPTGPAWSGSCYLPAASPSSPPQGLCTCCPHPPPSYTATWLTLSLALRFCSDVTLLVRPSLTTQKSRPSSLLPPSPFPALSVLHRTYDL